ASAGVPSPAPSAEGGGLAAPPVPGDAAWVAEIWVDPDWYAHERPEDPMPSAGLPGLVTLRQRSLLVGRPSRSRGITPDIDCGSDPGVSRRHCQLTTDGQRWWVEDLGSSNGTFVSAAGDPLPDTPLSQGVRREIEENDRVFVGAWTRLVIRKALPGEA
ncbi:FHA domain-containing protein, partial [Promicromonospora kroppenstedtii]|uniref:FHA domain-containing protein n=1 Tax=Promicromonospora kroppenstedtii TaxID=440482 RepID=UPI001FDF455F